MAGGQLSDILDSIAEHTRHHRTTLIFVNTRKMAERVAHLLTERLAEDEPGRGGGDVDASLLVAAHHGSLSAARRRIVETRLRAGDLRALVATASLELGIDVGPVELVCQIGSPRAIGTFLQRVGRANHHRDGTPAGRLYPQTRDELVECTALLAAVREGRLDLLEPPVAPLDVLTQQLVAEVAAADERDVEAMWEMTRRAAPYAELSRENFDEVVALASWGIETGRGRRGAHLHHDAVNGRLRARRGARLAALTGGGAIPETGDYRVVLDPDGVTVGSVHEDFAVEATAGDIFLLGTHSWRVAKVEVGTVRVHDAGDLPPTVPFWLGEAPARTAELSEAVSDLRAALEPVLLAGDGDGARRLVCERAGVTADVAQQVVAYCAAGLAALGHLPTRERIVVERCFDESEGSQLIVHAPFGGRINRALGLALRKRFCVSFDFELQAAADDDTVVLSLGPQHSFPLTRVQSMLSSAQARRGADPGRAAPPDARGALALEPHPGAGPAAHERRQAPADPPPAHGGRRPARRGVAGPGRLPGERAGGPGGGARPRPGAPDGLRLPARGPLGRGPRRPVVQGRVGRHRGAHGGVERAVAAVPRDPERTPLHLPRRRAPRGAAHPRPLVAPRPGPARPRRAPGAGRRDGGARPRRGGRRARTAVPRAAQPRRAARPLVDPGGVPARSGPGRSGSTPWRPTAAPASSTAAGWRPSVARWRPLWGQTTRPRPPAWPDTCSWPGR